MKGQKKKALWAKKRAENAAKREDERKANLPKRVRRTTKITVLLGVKDSKYVITDAMRRAAELPSASDSPIKKGSPVKPKPDHPLFLTDPEEYARREEAANKEIARKKKRTAPLWNKGGYQYVGDDTDPEIIKNLGKKV